MNVFPIDPTPIIIPYAIIVFLFPWLVFVYFCLRRWGIISNKFPRFDKTTDSDSIGKIQIKWMLITFLCWFLGFALMAGTLFLLEENNLLINHSKGIY